MANDPVDLHLARFHGAQRAALDRTRATIAKALPGAEEMVSYGMPTFKISGVAVVGFDGFAEHNSLFPYSGSVVASMADELPDLVTSKGTVQFPIDQPFPAAVLTRVLKKRIAEINDTFPRKNGEVKEFYDNGHLKLSGRMRGDRMHGAWKWYRRDGSLMRTGSFRDGVRTGIWTTHDRNGSVIKTTRF